MNALNQNLNIGRSLRSHELTLKHPFETHQLRAELPLDAVVDSVDITALSVRNGNEIVYRLKPGYQFRIAAGSKAGANYLSEDFLNEEGKRGSGNYEVAFAAIVNEIGDAIHVEMNISGKDNVTAHDLKINVNYYSSAPMLFGHTLRQELPTFELRMPVQALHVRSLIQQKNTNQTLIIADNNVELLVDNDTIENIGLSENQYIVFSGALPPLVFTEEHFEKMFSSDNPLRGPTVYDERRRLAAEVVDRARGTTTHS